jgi:uncharacterized protein YggE
MTKTALLPASLLLAISIAAAQTPNSVQASGSATRNVNPDMAQLNVGVVTQATTAQAAADQNAATTDAVIKALQGVLSSAGTIKTLYYSISPRYVSSAGQQTLAGYIVTNTLQVTTTVVGRVGPLIDAANAAGANSISGPFFGLQNPDPEVQLALAAAAKEALAHASAIAGGLGAKTGAVISAQEGSTVRPLLEGAGSGPTAASVPTPIQTGTVSVSAYVSVTVALVQ